MHCPKCQVDINDPAPECPRCGFHIRQLDEVLGTPPERAAPLLDLAGVVSEAGRGPILERLRTFVTRTGCEFLVVTRPDTAPRLPSEYVFWLFNRWNVGGENHAGLLILLAMKERRIEVEVGFDLERFVSDEAAGLILQHHAVPFLKRGDVDGGLYHACDVLCRLVEDGVEQEKAAAPATDGSTHLDRPVSHAVRSGPTEGLPVPAPNGEPAREPPKTPSEHPTGPLLQAAEAPLGNETRDAPGQPESPIPPSARADQTTQPAREPASGQGKEG